ncbi:hypothetical protein ACLOJK_034257 [Asimina triloba]
MAATAATAGDATVRRCHRSKPAVPPAAAARSQPPRCRRPPCIVAVEHRCPLPPHRLCPLPAPVATSSPPSSRCPRPPTTAQIKRQQSSVQQATCM